MYSEESSMIPGVYNMFDGMFYTFGHLQNCPPGVFFFRGIFDSYGVSTDPGRQQDPAGSVITRDGVTGGVPIKGRVKKGCATT